MSIVLRRDNLQYLLNCKRMLRLGENIYANFQLEKPKSKSTEQVSILLLGNCGVGKSKLTNNICGSCQQIGIVKKSLTTFLFEGNCQYEKLLRIYDSPGLGSSDERSQNQLLSGLKNFQFHAVTIIAKLDARFGDKTLTELIKISKIFKKQMNGLIFLISHLDMLESQRDEILIKFSQCLEQYDINQKVILFSNQNSDFKVLSEVLYRCALGQQRKRWRIEKKKIKTFFKCIQITDQFDQIIEEKIRDLKENPEKNKLENNKENFLAKNSKQTNFEKVKEDKKDIRNNNVSLKIQKDQNKEKNKSFKDYQKNITKKGSKKLKNNRKYQDDKRSNGLMQQNLFKYRYSTQSTSEQNKNKCNNNFQSIRINPRQILIFLIVVLLITLTFLMYPSLSKKNNHKKNLRQPKNRKQTYQMKDEKNKKKKMVINYDDEEPEITMEDF